MIKRILIVAIAVPLLTTCQLFKSDRRLTRQDPQEPATLREMALDGQGCNCKTVLSLLDGLEACERRAKVCEAGDEEEDEKPDGAAHSPQRVRVRRVVVNGPPKKCSGGKRPEISPVPQSECQDGMVCLSGKGQLALAVNLAAYEKFVNKIMECENEK